MTIKNAERLIIDVESKIMNNEYNTVTLKGVRNLSRANLESVIMYAEAYISSGGTGFAGLMSPMGNEKELLLKYGLEEKYSMW